MGNPRAKGKLVIGPLIMETKSGWMSGLLLQQVNIWLVWLPTSSRARGSVLRERGREKSEFVELVYMQ